MTRKAEPPGRAGQGAAVALDYCGNDRTISPTAQNPQAIPRRATAASAAACRGWPQRIEVSDSAVKKAGGSTAKAREVWFVRAGLAAAGPDAARRALQVRLRPDDRIADALPLDLRAAP